MLNKFLIFFSGFLFYLLLLHFLFVFISDDDSAIIAWLQ